ncbi:TPA: hypothetical protein ACGYRL_001855, partial [Streptococcus pyogenes]
NMNRDWKTVEVAPCFGTLAKSENSLRRARRRCVGSIPTVPVAFNANSIFLLKSLLYLLCKGFFNSIIKVIKNMEIKYGKQTRKSKFL